MRLCYRPLLAPRDSRVVMLVQQERVGAEIAVDRERLSEALAPAVRMETKATVLHANLDAFYASVEQLLDSRIPTAAARKLRNSPSVVVCCLLIGVVRNESRDQVRGNNRAAAGGPQALVARAVAHQGPANLDRIMAAPTKPAT